MIFRQLNQGTACRTYLIADEGSREALIVDPVLDHVSDYLIVLRSLRLELRYVVDTHLHADHRSGGPALKARTGARYVRHRAAGVGCSDVLVDDGDVLTLGETALRVMHTPGHSADAISLLLADRVLTGDALLLGESGAGRTDVGTGDAAAQWESLRKLAALDEATLVFPGHAYRGKDLSTIGEERRTNPHLRASEKDAFVQAQRALQTGPSDWMRTIVRDNTACAVDAETVFVSNPANTCEPGGSRGDEHRFTARVVSRDTFRTLAADASLLVLDVSGHDTVLVAGALKVPLARVLDWALAHVADAERPVVTVCENGQKAARAAAILSESGFTHVRSLAGGVEKPAAPSA